MSFSARSLYARAGLWRPDIKDTAFFGFCLDEVIRNVCRETMAARIDVTIPFVSGTSALSVATAMGDVGDLVKIHSVSGVVTDSTTSSYQIGDVIHLEETLFTGNAGSDIGECRYWAQMGDNIYLYSPPVGYSGDLYLNVSYAPPVGTDAVPLPTNAIDAVEAGLEMMAYRLPGRLANINESIRIEKRYKRAIARIRTEAYWGSSGQPELRIDATPFC